MFPKLYHSFMAGSTPQVSLPCTYFIVVENTRPWHGTHWVGLLERQKGESRTVLLVPSHQHKEPQALTKTLQPQAPLEPWEDGIVLDTSHRNPAGVKAQEPNSNELPRWQEMVAALLLWLKPCHSRSFCSFPRASLGISTWVFPLLCRHRSYARGNLDISGWCPPVWFQTEQWCNHTRECSSVRDKAVFG